MLVKITNIGSAQVHIPAYGKVLNPGDIVETQRSMSDLHGDSSLKALIDSGNVAIVLTLEAGDQFSTLQSGAGDLLPSYTNAARPDPTTVAAGFAIFNTDDGFPNWSDGTVWKDATGLTT